MTERRPSIVCLAEKNGKSVPNSSLCSTRYSIALTSAWYSSQRRVHEPRDVGVDVRVTPDDGDRLVEPRMADVGDHDLELRVPQRDLVEQDRPRQEQRSGAGEGRSLVDQHRQLEPLERLADAEELGAERVDVLVDRAELAADEAEVALHPLQLVDRRAVGRVDGAEADQPGGIARDVRGDVVVGDDEAGRRGVEGQDDRAIDVRERVAVVVVQAPAERTSGQAAAPPPRTSR